MENEMYPEKQVEHVLTAAVCPGADRWLGVCDEHEAHWTGYLKEEVEAVGRAHQEFWVLDPEDDGGCHILYVNRDA